MIDRLLINSWNPTVLGLAMDMLGFFLVFLFGGFDIGKAHLLLENDRSKEMNPVKVLGAILIIVGFAFQIWGALW